MDCTKLSITGWIFEGLGLGLITWEIWLVQLREFGIPGPLKGVLRFLGLARPQPVKATVGMPYETERAMPVRPIEGGGTVEQRLERLERRYDALSRELDETREQLDDRIGTVERHAEGLHAQLRLEQTERERERREQLRVAVRFQGVGTFLIALGVLLSVLGSTVTC